jgi:hypothetical protein
MHLPEEGVSMVPWVIWNPHVVRNIFVIFGWRERERKGGGHTTRKSLGWTKFTSAEGKLTESGKQAHWAGSPLRFYL